MDLRLTDEQMALREEAAAFAQGLRPLLEADPAWRRQGMLSDGDSRDVTLELGRAGWIGVDAALAEEVLGYHWLPLSLYLLSYKTIGCALERFGSPELKERLLHRIARGSSRSARGSRSPRREATLRRSPHARRFAAIGSSSTVTRSGRPVPGSPTGSTWP